MVKRLFKIVPFIFLWLFCSLTKFLCCSNSLAASFSLIIRCSYFFSNFAYFPSWIFLFSTCNSRSFKTSTNPSAAWNSKSILGQYATKFLKVGLKSWKTYFRGNDRVKPYRCEDENSPILTHPKKIEALFSLGRQYLLRLAGSF